MAAATRWRYFLTHSRTGEPSQHAQSTEWCIMVNLVPDICFLKKDYRLNHVTCQTNSDRLEVMCMCACMCVCALRQIMRNSCLLLGVSVLWLPIYWNQHPWEKLIETVHSETTRCVGAERREVRRRQWSQYDCYRTQELTPKWDAVEYKLWLYCSTVIG